MLQALTLADKAAAAGEVPVGAVVTLHDAIIGRGHNRSLIDHDPSAHAEVIALREAARAEGSFRIDGATLYVTLEPCLMCCGALLQARIARVVFGAREPKSGAVISVHETLMAPGATHHVAVTEGVLAAGCSQRLSDFFAQRRQQQ